MRPKVSVVIPVYNRAHSVLPTLKSVQDQTMRDFECIVVDDGSRDGEELRRVVERLNDPRFRYVRRENGGASAARNTGIDEAGGEIIAFLDSDDRWLPEKLQRDVDAGADRRVVFSPVLIERGGRVVGQQPKTSPRPGEEMGDYVACRGGWTPTPTISLPLVAARAVRFDEKISFGDDTDFAIRLAASRTPFYMLREAAVIVVDDESGDRLSRSGDWRAVLEWLDRIRPLISRRAYLAYRGWHVARLAANEGHYSAAVQFCLVALIGGALPPRLAAKALGQIFIRRSVYARFRH